jgi:tripartite-type tricarboxylate transporter receptor subunit TctC
MRHSFIAAILAVSIGAGSARADEAIKLIVSFPAGGPVDAAARLLASEMQGLLSTTIVIENRGGGGGVIATDFVARAPADGKTLLMGSQGAHVISGLLQPNVKYDPVQSFTPIAMIGHASMLLVADPKLPANNFKEMLELAKTRKLSYGSAGAGTVMNIAGELINSGANVHILHVPYRGVAPALPDLMAGRLDLLPADPPVLLPQVEAKTVKPLALFGIERLSALPAIPTTVELGYPGMVMENWYGLLAPSGLPSDIASRLEKAALAAIASPAIQLFMQKGELRGTLNAREFRARIETDVAYWRPMLVELGISAEATPSAR